MKNNIIYRHLKPCGEIFYIGIGKTKQRAYSKQSRNPLWHNIVNKYGYEVQILKEGLSWEEAVELECVLIDYYGRRDLGLGPLVNMTDGGEGILNYTHSDETRAKISKSHTGKKHTEETLKKMSLSKKGEKHHNAKKVICTKTGKIWHTVGICAKDNGLNRDTLKGYLNGKSRNKTTFKYLENLNKSNLRLINI